ncbi:MAG TPA: class III extradiol ring-cleavage dioxygenase [Polyangiaceae bacterium]|nr:class III extradiol ring-cleavage dioxygenase [Polyangiaceae bacterium]
MTAAAQRIPVVFLPHGGGPWPFVRLPFGSEAEQADLARYLRTVRHVPESPPQALLVISAHWEQPRPTVMNGKQPPLLFDYYGFPKESYELTWPAPGAPELAQRVQSLLAAAGIASDNDGERGFDHGTFVPLKLAYPDAEIPTVQLSLKAGLDPKEHLAIGRALEPLRSEGVFIIGSGMTYHNMRAMGPQGRPAASAFDAWLRDAATRPARERESRLAEWTSAPAARAAHPREEHLLPLMVVAGAAGDDVGRVSYHGTLLGLELSAYTFS